MAVCAALPITQSVSIPAHLLQMIILAVTAHMVLAGVRITTSLYALSLHASSLVVGTLIALFALLPMLFAVPAGRWQDRIGMRKPLTLGCVAMLVGCAQVLLVHYLRLGAFWSLAALYLAAASVGLGFMMMHVASQTLVGRISDDSNRSRNFSWLAMGFSTSGFGGPILAGLAIDHFSHQAAYLLFAVLAAATLLMARSWRFPCPQQEQSLAVHQGGAADLFWRDKNLREIYYIGILISASWDLFAFVIPIYGTQRGFSASTIGLIMGMFALATFVIRLLMPLLNQRWHAWQIVFCVLALTCACFLVLPWLHQAWSIMLLAFLLGLGLGASQPNMLSLLHTSAPEGRGGEAVGIRVTIGNATQVALPLVFGAVGASLGLMPVFFVMTAWVASGLPLVWRRF